jgi:uncharacterized protein (TIGR02145 family)
MLIAFISMFIYSCEKHEAILKKDPVIIWENPADIGTAAMLNSQQLNATANVPGTFVYTPSAGTRLYLGKNQDLRVDFTPTDTTNYNIASKTVKINVVLKATVTDIDGNVYHTVIIGNQVWMAENLKTTKYSDGDPIPNIIDSLCWMDYSNAYCIYKNDTNNSNPYGRLYQSGVMANQNIAPIGWHVPTDEEWSILTTYLGGESIAGGKLKETGLTHWLSPNTGATNETGFTALPGAQRSNLDGSFYGIGIFGFWWTSTPEDANNIYIRCMLENSSSILRFGCWPKVGCSIRCIRD